MNGTTTCPRRRRSIAAAALAAMTALVLAACSGSGGSGDDSTGSSGGDGGETLRIGALYLDSQGFYGGVKKGVQNAADAMGANIELVESNSEGDASKESTFMDTLISSGVSAIIIAAVSEDGSVAAVRQAHQAGIPVICYNTCVNQEAMDEYVTAYVVGDPEEFGRMAGEAAGNYFKDAGDDAPEFGVINCEQYEVCQRRQAGFEEALTEILPGAKIVANQEGTIADQAVEVAEQELTANPTITGLYGQSGGATVGTFKGVQARGMVGEVVAFGSDMTTDIATALADGDVLQAVVDISGIEVGELAFDAAYDAAQGNERDEMTIDAPITLWTTDTAQEWLDSHPDGLP